MSGIFSRNRLAEEHCRSDWDENESDQIRYSVCQYGLNGDEIYLLETSPLFFLIVGRLSSDGDCWLLLLLCASSMAAEFGVGNADGTDVGVAIICCILGLDSLLMVCDWPATRPPQSTSHTVSEQNYSRLFVFEWENAYKYHCLNHC